MDASLLQIYRMIYHDVALIHDVWLYCKTSKNLKGSFRDQLSSALAEVVQKEKLEIENVYNQEWRCADDVVKPPGKVAITLEVVVQILVLVLDELTQYPIWYAKASVMLSRGLVNEPIIQYAATILSEVYAKIIHFSTHLSWRSMFIMIQNSSPYLAYSIFHSVPHIDVTLRRFYAAVISKLPQSPSMASQESGLSEIVVSKEDHVNGRAKSNVGNLSRLQSGEPVDSVFKIPGSGAKKTGVGVLSRLVNNSRVFLWPSSSWTSLSSFDPCTSTDVITIDDAAAPAPAARSAIINNNNSNNNNSNNNNAIFVESSTVSGSRFDTSSKSSTKSFGAERHPHSSSSRSLIFGANVSPSLSAVGRAVAALVSHPALVLAVRMTATLPPTSDSQNVESWWAAAYSLLKTQGIAGIYAGAGTTVLLALLTSSRVFRFSGIYETLVYHSIYKAIGSCNTTVGEKGYENGMLEITDPGVSQGLYSLKGTDGDKGNQAAPMPPSLSVLQLCGVWLVHTFRTTVFTLTEILLPSRNNKGQCMSTDIPENDDSIKSVMLSVAALNYKALFMYAGTSAAYSFVGFGAFALSRVIVNLVSGPSLVRKYQIRRRRQILDFFFSSKNRQSASVRRTSPRLSHRSSAVSSAKAGVRTSSSLKDNNGSSDTMIDHVPVVATTAAATANDSLSVDHIPSYESSGSGKLERRPTPYSLMKL